MRPGLDRASEALSYLSAGRVNNEPLPRSGVEPAQGSSKSLVRLAPELLTPHGRVVISTECRRLFKVVSLKMVSHKSAFDGLGGVGRHTQGYTRLGTRWHE